MFECARQDRSFYRSTWIQQTIKTIQNVSLEPEILEITAGIAAILFRTNQLSRGHKVKVIQSIQGFKTTFNTIKLSYLSDRCIVRREGHFIH